MSNSSKMQPRRPSHLPSYVAACLQTLSERGLGEKISLGGALGLLHYLDYRPTHDVDAWWDASATAEDQRQVIHLIEMTLAPFGQVNCRAWGDVVNVELSREGETIFSFQIAHRSAQLEPSTLVPFQLGFDKLSSCGKLWANLPVQEESDAQENLHRRLNRRRTCILAGFHQERRKIGPQAQPSSNPIAGRRKQA